MKVGQDGALEMNPIYECLTPLRCVLAKKFAPENWKVVEAMEQGRGERTLQRKYSSHMYNLYNVNLHTKRSIFGHN